MLDNTQRHLLGLDPVGDGWEMVEIGDNHYFFDGDIVRKVIRVNANGSGWYEEEDLFEQTAENRTVVLPKTKRGKPRKLLPSVADSFRPIGMCFRFWGNSVLIENKATHCTYCEEEIGRGEAFESLLAWLKRWADETTDDDQEELERFKAARPRRYKYREGDFFAVRTGRHRWAFGRIFSAGKGVSCDGADNSGGGRATLAVGVYLRQESRPFTDIDTLAACGMLPVELVFDDDFHCGNNIIIGNRPVVPGEWEPCISFGRGMSLADMDKAYLRYGAIIKQTTTAEFDRYVADGHYGHALGYPDSASGNLHSEMLMECLAAEGITDLLGMPDTNAVLSVLEDSFWSKNVYRQEGVGFRMHHQEYVADCLAGLKSPDEILPDGDLRKQECAEAKSIIFNYFGLDASKSYADNLRIARGV